MPRPATLRTTTALAEAGLIAREMAETLEEVAARYAIAVTPEMAALIDPRDPADSIARQFVPDARELLATAEERADPIGDDAFTPVPGIVHRYPDRALLKPLHACPVYCRFCFRREMVGPAKPALDARGLETAFAYIADHPAIWEVIVTGGDPFMLSPRRAARITSALAAIPHVKVARWHTRVPIVDPARVTPAFVAGLVADRVTTVVGVHANHPREFTPAARVALARLADAGIMLVSQTVLLKGVNDDVATLDALMRAFMEHRVKPYYLHQGDLAPGTSHWRTTVREGRALMRALRGRLSGLAMPAYVLDVPDGAGKVPLGPDHVAETADGDVVIETLAGERRPHPPLSRTMTP